MSFAFLPFFRLGYLKIIRHKHGCIQYSLDCPLALYPMSLCFCISFSFMFLLPSIPNLCALILKHTNPLRMDPDTRELEGRNICLSCPLGSLLSSTVFINTLKPQDPQKAEAL